MRRDNMTGTISTRDLTILTVSFGEPELILRNRALVSTLNSDADLIPWIVVDNDGRFAREAPPFERLTVVAGEPFFRGSPRDRGSFHHASGLNSGFRNVRTRFVLVLDPDFYVVRKDWVSEVLAYMPPSGLAIFGVPWHPRWRHQPRYVPAVHFLLVDLELVNREEIDFDPGPRNDWLYSRPVTFLPPKLRSYLAFGRFKDTGCRLPRSVRPGAGIELLVPSFRPPIPGALRHVMRLVCPDVFCSVPKRRGYFTKESFLETDSPAAYQLGWEEFFWRGQPFGFHLRGVGRKYSGQATEEEREHLAGLLDRYMAQRS